MAVILLKSLFLYNSKFMYNNIKKGDTLAIMLRRNIYLNWR